ncbi:MAG TPA: acyl-CoA reductase [Bacteroidia bacterium]|jgi:hypothetical protein|nr:acyl-CoA reductase [Bacteroidia bacterium]
MKLTDIINSFHKLGEEIRAFLANSPVHQDWNNAIQLAEHQNGWFTRANILLAFQGIETWLHKDKLVKWLSAYPELPKENTKPITISVVMAGNIPLVGFHDFLCVLITGNTIQAKLSSSDVTLLKFLAKKLIAINPELEKHIQFVEKLSSSANAVIATGSNNTARHFEYYFRNTPNIIRRNRNGVAILDGSETSEEIGNLGNDIFTYFGLGCRNVSKLYIPQDFELSQFFLGIEKFRDVVNHNKYANNYTYNRTIFLMDGKVFTDNNFLAVIEDKTIPSPIAVLHFERYKDLAALSKELSEQKELIQCIAAKDSVAKKLKNLSIPVVGLGETQSPTLSDYADGVDVIKFILSKKT